MTFRSIELLALVALVPFALLFLIARENHRTHIARRFISERLRGVSHGLRPLRPWFLAAALALIVIAVAGPRSGFVSVRIPTRESSRIIVIDVSHSMAARDVGTSRLAAAKALAKRLVDAQPGRVGLVVFEANAEILSPLTTDIAAVGELIDTIGAGEVGHPGSDIGAALTTALRLTESDPSSRADVVLISDGEEQGTRLREVMRRLREGRVVVSTILLGRAEGSTIPGPGGDLRDDSGRVVTTYARADILESIAAESGGRFLENPFTENALDPLIARQRRGAEREAMVQVPIERYQWPLAAAFFLLLAGSLANRGAE